MFVDEKSDVTDSTRTVTIEVESEASPGLSEPAYLNLHEARRRLGD